MAPEMDRLQSEELHSQLREAVRLFVRRECSREVVDALEEDPLGYSPDHWRVMADLGWLGLLIPEGYGGLGASLQEMAIVVEELGAAGLPSPLFSTVIETGLLIDLAGNEQQRRVWLPSIAGGRALWAVGLLEPGTGLEPSAIRTCAAGLPDGYRLTGTKLFVPYVEQASHLLCVARTGDSTEALSLFCMPTETPGLRAIRLRTTNNDPQYEVRFDDVQLPDSSLVGDLNRAWGPVSSMLDQAAALKCAELVGMGRRALDLTVSFVSERVQFGQPLGKFQAVQHHCADMYRDLEQTRVLTAQAIWRLADGRQAEREVSLAKIKASEGIPALLRMAHQLHGGVGYDAAYPLGTLYRRSMWAQSAYGSASWHRAKLGRLLLTDPNRFRREGAHPLPVLAGGDLSQVSR